MERIDVLFKAVYDGDLAAVTGLVHDQPDFARARNADTLSVLQFARYMRHEDLLEALIACGPPLDLYESASLNRTHTVAELLDAQPELLNSVSPEGFTPL